MRNDSTTIKRFMALHHAVLFGKDHFPSFDKSVYLELVQIHTAREIYGIPRYRMSAGHEVLAEECCNFAAEKVEYVERDKSSFYNPQRYVRRGVKGIWEILL